MAKDDDADDKKLASRLVEALNKAIQAGPWDRGLLFQTIGNKLKALKEKFEQELDLSPTETSHATPPHTVSTDAEFITVYISLYMLDGQNLPKWEKLLNAVSSNIVTRPIYQQETDLQTAIRAKENKLNDAYTCARIRKSDIIPPPDNKPPVDRFGHPLLILRQGAIQPSNILYFRHKTGKYLLKNARLIKQSESEPIDCF